MNCITFLLETIKTFTHSLASIAGVHIEDEVHKLTTLVDLIHLCATFLNVALKHQSTAKMRVNKYARDYISGNSEKVMPFRGIKSGC